MAAEERPAPRRVTVDEAALYSCRTYTRDSDVSSMRSAMSRIESPAKPCPPARPESTPCSLTEKLLCIMSIWIFYLGRGVAPSQSFFVFLFFGLFGK